MATVLVVVPVAIVLAALLILSFAVVSVLSPGRGSSEMKHDA